LHAGSQKRDRIVRFELFSPFNFLLKHYLSRFLKKEMGIIPQNGMAQHFHFVLFF